MQRIDSREIHTNDNLPVLYIDGVRIYQRQDGFNLIRFTANLPEAMREQVRIMVDNDNLHRILDILCQSANYYPEKSLKEKIIPK